MTLSIDQFSRSQRNRFTSVRLDRLVEYRDDARWIAAVLDSDSTRLVPMWRSRNLLSRNEEGSLALYLRSAELPQHDLIQPPTLLGSDDKRTYFTVAVTDGQKDEILARFPGSEFADLRRASVDMDAKHAGILAYAKALHYWQHRHRFCGACGSPNQLRSAGHRLICSNEECQRQSFPRIDPAIIVLVTHQDACLLGRKPSWPEHRYSTLAGFVEPGESLEDAVAREVFEEVGVRLTRLRYVSSQPWPFPASSMCGFYAEAASRDIALSEEIVEAQWLTVEELNNGLAEGTVVLPPLVSIAFRLVADWYRHNGGGDLEAACRRLRRQRPHRGMEAAPC